MNPKKADSQARISQGYTTRFCLPEDAVELIKIHLAECARRKLEIDLHAHLTAGDPPVANHQNVLFRYGKHCFLKNLLEGRLTLTSSQWYAKAESDAQRDDEMRKGMQGPSGFVDISGIQYEVVQRW